MGDDLRFEVLEIQSRASRRRFLKLAIMSTAGVVFPMSKVLASHSYGYCTPDDVGGTPDSVVTTSIIEYPPNGEWGLSGGSHFSSAPRRSYIMIHHHGSPNTDQITNPCNSCSRAGIHQYDFCISRNGRICNTNRWPTGFGAHATGCNGCNIGIMLQGCFGGCSSGNVWNPSDQQVCSLAWLSLHLGTPADSWRHNPHQYCHHWNCDGASVIKPTACPGNHLTTHPNHTGLHWNSRGQGMINKMLNYRNNIRLCGSCFRTC